MHEKQLFEYAVIRLVPRVEREEFLNVGVIVYCAKQKKLHCAIRLTESRLLAVFPEADISLLKSHLDAFTRICCAADQSGPIARLDGASRFRWLTAKRSTMVQTSPVHPGMTSSFEGLTEKLLGELVD